MASLIQSARIYVRPSLKLPKKFLLKLTSNFVHDRFYTEKFVRVTDVSPRDGLQNEKKLIPLKIKLELIERLASTGIKYIESGSFVSPRWVPQMADSDRILEHILKKPTDLSESLTYSFLVPNTHGLNTLLSHLQAHNPTSSHHKTLLRKISIFVSATETFSQRNLNCSVKTSLQRAKLVIDAARAANLQVCAYISVVLGCPYEGPVCPSKVAHIATDLLDMGVSEIALGDTTGMGTKLTTLKLLNTIKAAGVRHQYLSMHLHDTYGMSITNMVVGLEHGIRSFDGSVAGLGGCPYSPGATGNVGTEDIVYLCNTLGLKTNIDLDLLVMVGDWASHVVGRTNGSRVGNALLKKLKS